MNKKNSTSKHVRINDTFLGPLERKVIDWFVKSAPDWVTSDMMTYLGFVGSVLIFVGYYLTQISPHFLWMASFGVLLNWFGDSTDGNLARYRHLERPRYGFFLDHSMDTISMLLIFGGLGLSVYFNFTYAMIGLVSYLLMSVFVYVDTYINGTFQISFAKIGPTESRAIIIIANILIFLIGIPTYALSIGTFTLYDFIMIGFAAALCINYLIMIIKRLNMLAKLEPAIPYHHKVKKSSNAKAGSQTKIIKQEAK